MTFLWLVIWILWGTPELHGWNKWAVALFVCILLDLLDKSKNKK